MSHSQRAHVVRGLRQVVAAKCVCNRFCFRYPFDDFRDVPAKNTRFGQYFVGIMWSELQWSVISGLWFEIAGGRVSPVGEA